MSNFSKQQIDDLFGSLTAETASRKEEKQDYTDHNLYEPKPKQAKDGVYKAVIRFVPHIHENKLASYFCKSTAFLRDVNKENLLVTDTLFLGNRNLNGDVIKTASIKLWKQGTATSQAKSRQLDNINTYYYSLIQVVKDVVNPDLNGKFMVYRFGETIRKTIETSLNGTEFSAAVNVFSPFDAPLFEINLSTVSKKIGDKTVQVPTYDACKFITTAHQIQLEDGTVVNSGDDASKAKMIEFLQTKSELINSYRFKPWSEETRQKVQAIIDTYFDDTLDMGQAISAEVIQTVNRPATKPKAKPASEPDALPQVEPSAPKSNGGVNGDTDDFLANLLS